MYFHGLDGFNSQLTRVATSRDSIHFQGLPEKLGRSYFRVFQHAGMTYALVMPGRIYRSKDGLTSFEEGPVLFNPKMRHSALLKRGDLLYVFWTQVGDVPERILLSTIDLSVPWEQWSETAGVEVLRPEREWEGAKEPLKPSLRSVAYGPVNQLRDPAIYEEDGACFSAVCGGGRERYCDRGSAFRGGRRVARPRTPHVLRRGEETKAWTEAHGGGRDARTRKATCKSRQVEQELILK